MDTLNTPNEEISTRINAISRIKAYKHPRSGRGIGQDTSLNFRILDRLLRQGLKDFADAHNDLIEQLGVPKNKLFPQGAKHVPRDSANWTEFQRRARELRESCLKLPGHLLIKLAELQVRDEEDEWEKMDEGAIADLGELLEEPKDPVDPEVDEPKPPKKKRVKPERPGG